MSLQTGGGSDRVCREEYLHCTHPDTGQGVVFALFFVFGEALPDFALEVHKSLQAATGPKVLRAARISQVPEVCEVHRAQAVKKFTIQTSGAGQGSVVPANFATVFTDG